MKLSLFILCALVGFQGAYAEEVTVVADTHATAPSEVQAQSIPEEAVAQTASEAEAWLKLVDNGKYEESWQAASPTMELIMKQKEWVIYLKKIRKPMGSLVKRTLMEQRIASNPEGVPKGNYMVMAYQTAFTDRPKANELLILSQGADGHWRPLSYFVK